MKTKPGLIVFIYSKYCRNEKIMKKLKAEVGVKESLTMKLLRSRLKCAGDVERMEGERLTKKADTLRMDGRRRRRRSGRPRLGWEDCLKKDFAGVERCEE